MTNFFITGTDTGVGKTWFTVAFMTALKRRGLNVMGMKPIATGAEKIKEIEVTTNHDVKAIEYYIQGKVKKALYPWIHFALTSEDINNLSYSLMWRDGLKQVYLPTLQTVNKELKKLAQKYKNSSMLALTHGQPATPTTFGKDL